MKKNYFPFWVLVFAAFAIVFAVSAFDGIDICGFRLKSSGMYDRLFSRQEADSVLDAVADSIFGAVIEENAGDDPVPVDTLPKTILLIGDSMLEGLSPRLAAYAEANGHTLYTVIWYSSTSEVWGASGKLEAYIKQLNPDYLFICLGANELFVKDIIEKRDRYVKALVREAGDIPFVWIGPPNWKPDTGINRLIAANVPDGSYFKSDGMHFDRSKDGAHPTRSSASMWMDSVVRWMPLHSSHPIRLDIPDKATGKPKRIFVHQPDER